MIARDKTAAWLCWAVAGAGAAALAALLGWYGPAPGPHAVLCPSRRLFDLSCAGCGMTRAFAALARGRLADAVALHPLAPVFALEGVLIWLGWAARNAGVLRPPSSFAVAVWLALNATASIVVWLARWALGTLPA